MFLPGAIPSSTVNCPLLRSYQLKQTEKTLPVCVKQTTIGVRMLLSDCIMSMCNSHMEDHGAGNV